MVKGNTETYKPCIITNPKKRMIYVPMHSENHSNNNLSESDGFYPKEIKNYHLGKVGILLKRSKKELKKLEELCYCENSIKIINPIKTDEFSNPIEGVDSFRKYLRKNMNNHFNKMVFVMVYDSSTKDHLKIVPFHQYEVLSTKFEEKIRGWTQDRINFDYCLNCMDELSELKKSFFSDNKKDLFSLPIEWVPYATHK